MKLLSTCHSGLALREAPMWLLQRGNSEGLALKHARDRAPVERRDIGSQTLPVAGLSPLQGGDRSGGAPGEGGMRLGITRALGLERVSGAPGGRQFLGLARTTQVAALASCPVGTCPENLMELQDSGLFQLPQSPAGLPAGLSTGHPRTGPATQLAISCAAGPLCSFEVGLVDADVPVEMPVSMPPAVPVAMPVASEADDGDEEENWQLGLAEISGSLPK